MSEIKLTYFDIRARGEVIRLALSVGGIAFTDERVGGPTWKPIRDEMPYKSLPVLTIDGAKYAQTPAIQRYVGKLAGLYPSDAIAAMRVDEILGALEDIILYLFSFTRGDAEDKKRVRQSVGSVAVPRYFGVVEKRMKEWGSGGFCVGDSMTIADLAVLCIMVDVRAGFYADVPTDVFDGYAGAVALFDKLMEVPAIAKWFKEHPQSGSV